jgi:hypothetical protein
MRFSVETWAPEYGTPTDGTEDETTATVDPEIELPASQWRSIAPEAEARGDVVFVDGVRRVDANLWIEQPAGVPVLGLCATYAAGVVRCNGAADTVAAVVERGLFTSATDAADIETRHGVYQVKGTAGTTPPDLWLGIQQRMGELEGRVAAEHADHSLVIVDGPLSHHHGIPDAVGYIKTQHVQYLPEGLRDVMLGLPVGRRTPLFLVSGMRSFYSWYLRLAVAPGPMGGLVRCEVSADRSAAEGARIADRVTAMLPRFASHEHKDPRAPQNLYPIGGLERSLRRRLGDQRLMFRALRRSAGASR